MVRLKGGRLGICNAPSHLFQFHNGSIKSEFYPDDMVGVVRFQFHNGSIKSVKRRACDTLYVHVSIPQWFD